MKNRRLIIVLFSVFAYVVNFAGIIRDDANKQDHIDLANEPQFDCVGEFIRNDQSRGTCVLINDSTALTAAHIFIKRGNPNGNAAINYRDVKYTLRFKDKEYTIDSIVVHPNYFDTTYHSSFDIAIIKLSKKVEGIDPATIYHLENELGMTAYCVGYGSFNFATSKAVTGNIRLAGLNTIDSISGPMDSIKSLLLYDFDSPLDSTNNRMGDANPLDMEYISSGGDSGGGMFAFHNQVWYLIGICHSTLKHPGKNSYGDIAKFERVSYYHDWIVNNY